METRLWWKVFVGSEPSSIFREVLNMQPIHAEGRAIGEGPANEQILNTLQSSSSFVETV